jgi:hypothetical protein
MSDGTNYSGNTMQILIMLYCLGTNDKEKKFVCSLQI